MYIKYINDNWYMARCLARNGAVRIKFASTRARAIELLVAEMIA